MLIDCKLSLNCHIKHPNLKISKGIGILTKLRRYLSKGVLRTLFYTSPPQHINYGLLVWGNAKPSNLKLINKFTKSTKENII